MGKGAPHGDGGDCTPCSNGIYGAPCGNNGEGTLDARGARALPVATVARTLLLQGGKDTIKVSRIGFFLCCLT